MYTDIARSAKVGRTIGPAEGLTHYKRQALCKCPVLEADVEEEDATTQKSAKTFFTETGQSILEGGFW